MHDKALKLLFENINSTSCDFLINKISPSDLVIDKVYKISNVRKIITRYGPNILCKLENAGQLFLPKRIAEELTCSKSITKILQYYHSTSNLIERQQLMQFLQNNLNLYTQKIRDISCLSASHDKKSSKIVFQKFNYTFKTK